jgi:hypothetical protein
MSDEAIKLLRWALKELSESVYDDRGLTLDEYYSEDRRWGTGDFETYQRAKALIGGSGVAPRDGDAPAPANSTRMPGMAPETSWPTKTTLPKR